MMVDDSFDKTEVKDVIMEVFAESDKGKSLQIIETHRKLWMKVIGTRGALERKQLTVQQNQCVIQSNKALIVGTGFGNHTKAYMKIWAGQ